MQNNKLNRTGSTWVFRQSTHSPTFSGKDHSKQVWTGQPKKKDSRDWVWGTDHGLLLDIFIFDASGSNLFLYQTFLYHMGVHSGFGRLEHRVEWLSLEGITLEGGK
jgi:hypothetical protein